jgi:predicted dithiol-disulfide oxidoreductase (DUF899 family)
MGQLHDKSYPGESANYRAARDELLKAEMELRRKNSDVAAMRAALPLGGCIPEDYVFRPVNGTDVTLSELFGKGKDSLIIYSLMYGTDDDKPCPACTSIVDGLNGSAPHIMDRVNLAVVAKGPPDALDKLVTDRGWDNLNFYSSGNTTYNADYFAEAPDGDQLPMLNVFRRVGASIHHTYGSELFHAPSDEGQHPRHVDMLWPVWNALDLTVEGRGTDWFPRLSYD